MNFYNYKYKYILHIVIIIKFVFLSTLHAKNIDDFNKIGNISNYSTICKLCKFLVGSFSAVSKPIFESKHAVCSVFQAQCQAQARVHGILIWPHGTLRWSTSRNRFSKPYLFFFYIIMYGKLADFLFLNS